MKRWKVIARRSEGSITVEAALVLPVFLFFVLFLMNFIYSSIVSMALGTAVSETVKMVSANMYPVALSYEKFSQTEMHGKIEGAYGRIVKAREKYLDIEQTVVNYAELLPSPIGDFVKLIKEKREGFEDDMAGELSERIGTPIFRPLLAQFVDDRLIDPDRMTVSRVTLPNLKNRQNAYFGLEVSYRLPLRIPFLNRDWIVSEKAYERTWVGDSMLEASKPEASSGSIQLLAITPNPASRGRNARVDAKVTPGTKAKLTVIYKSGESKAKHLGEATADADGNVAWEWLVSGNTTPGTWQIVIEAENGEKLTADFHVIAKQAGNR